MTVLNQWVAIVRVKVNLTGLIIGDFGDDHTKHVDQLLSFDLLLLEVVKEPS